jgi:hypothetical protein
MILKKDSCTSIDDFVADMLLLRIQYTLQHHQRLFGHLLSEEQNLEVESIQWRSNGRG